MPSLHFTLALPTPHPGRNSLWNEETATRITPSTTSFIGRIPMEWSVSGWQCHSRPMQVSVCRFCFNIAWETKLRWIWRWLELLSCTRDGRHGLSRWQVNFTGHSGGNCWWLAVCQRNSILIGDVIIQVPASRPSATLRGYWDKRRRLIMKRSSWINWMSYF